MLKLINLREKKLESQDSGLVVPCFKHATVLLHILALDQRYSYHTKTPSRQYIYSPEKNTHKQRCVQLYSPLYRPIHLKCHNTNFLIESLSFTSSDWFLHPVNDSEDTVTSTFLSFFFFTFIIFCNWCCHFIFL